MDKRAEVITPLQPHQREALRRALAGNLVLAHSTGSGKILTSIAAADAIGRPTVVLTPASLVENYRSTLPPGKGTSVDEYLTTRSREKAALMARMLQAIQKGAPRPQETNDAIR